MGCSISRPQVKEPTNPKNPVHGSIYNIFRLLSDREPPRLRRDDTPPRDLDEHLKDVVDIFEY